MQRHVFVFCTMRLLAMACLLAMAQTTVSGQTRDEKVRSDRAEIADSGLWIYNDLPRGYAEAEQTGKPLLIVFR